ncbi:MAG TPA: 5'-methylthioadenosine/adenosylhomocysteine nucleosidase [Clostridiales bacterium]|nr:5'-methylthioadenosine/adenosylhomocysteine nucleosidase [Clostridiales bacterium]
MVIKKIGIIGAMDEEVNKTIKIMTNYNKTIYASMSFYDGEIDNRDVVVVRSGIGKVNAAICTQILIDLFKVDAIINTGIAGSLKNEINIGDMVISTDSIQHDVDASKFGYDPGVIPRMGTSTFLAEEYLINKTYDVCKKFLPHLSTFKGRVLSGDQFIAENSKKEWLANTFNGYCTEMEGAAIGQVANLNDIPYVIIRSISDKADNSAQMTYEEFEEQAINNTFILIQELIKAI